MYRCDEFRNLSGPDCMMPDITLDDSGGEMWIDLLRATAVSRIIVF